MNRQSIVFVLIIIFTSNFIFGQTKDNTEVEQIKKFLPYIIKGLQEIDKKPTTKKIDQRVVGLFEKPWLAKKIEQETARELLNSIFKNKSSNIKKDYRGKWNLNFSSQINPNKVITDVYNSNAILGNVFVTISNVELIDDNNVSIIETEERKIKINQSKKINFQTGGLQISFPLKKEYKNVAGSLNLTLKEFQSINYKEFNSNSKNEVFDLGGTKNLKLLKIENNKAYFHLPKAIENIKISSTNKKGEKYGENSKMSIPKVIFDYGTGGNITESDTKSLIENLTLEDLKEKPQVLMYETNGTIEQLYIYLKSNPKDLISKKMEIKR
jgi:hypothetical protein